MTTLRLVICFLAVLSFACSGPQRAFTSATVKLSDGAAAQSSGDLGKAARLYAAGGTVAEELVKKHGDSPIGKRVAAGKVKVGPFTIKELRESVLPRVALWAEADRSIVARAFFLAEKLDPLARVAVLHHIYDAYRKTERDDQAEVVLAALDADVRRHLPWVDRLIELPEVGLYYVEAGNPDAAFEIVDLLIEQMEFEAGEPLSYDMVAGALSVVLDMEFNDRVTEVVDRLLDLSMLIGDIPSANDFVEDVAVFLSEAGKCAEAYETLSLLETDFHGEGYYGGCGCDGEEYYEGDMTADEDYVGDQMYQRFDATLAVFEACIESDRETAILVLEEVVEMAATMPGSDFAQDGVWACASAGDFMLAEEILEAVDDPGERAEMELVFAEELFLVGREKAAMKVVKRVDEADFSAMSNEDRARTYKVLAAYFGSMSLKERQVTALARGIASARLIADPAVRLVALLSLLDACKLAGRTEEVSVLKGLAVEALGLLEAASTRGSYGVRTAEVFRRAGLLAEAESVLDGVLAGWKSEKDQASLGGAYCGLADQYGRLGNVSKAMSAAEAVLDDKERCACLPALATVLGEAGEVEGAQKVRDDWQKLSGTVEGKAAEVPQALPVKLPVDVARDGDCLKALEMIRDFPEAGYRPRLLAGVGEVCEAKGRKPGEAELKVLSAIE